MLVSPAHKKSWWLKFILYPIAWIYSTLIHLRHILYDYGLKKSTRFNFPIIVVGNLSLGGSGKTPFTAYLCKLLQDQYQLAILSRGYKRKSIGYVKVERDSLPSEVGDEPHWLKKNHPKVDVYVGEDRVLSISYLLQEKPYLEGIILDDAFQHRRLNAGMNILLTEYNNLFVDDNILPIGYLRDVKKSAERANIIIITKCPAYSISKKIKDDIRQKIHLSPYQYLFFSTIVYKTPLPIVENSFQFVSFRNTHVLLVTGIANPDPLIRELENRQCHVSHLNFADHFDFSYETIIKIITTFDKMPSPTLILCTEKDSVKLIRFEKYWKHLPIFIIPVETKILEEEDRFFQLIKNYMDSF